jgi:pimeloyl-ACP methyl ester carboxylesterase
MTGIRPFQFETSPQAVADLYRRLDATRWPDELRDTAAHDYGLPSGYLRELLTYWRHHFDWLAAQGRINAYPQYLLEIDGLPLHFIHARSAHTNAMPLLIAHGWPGSIVEFLDLIPRLTTPEQFGGRSEDAFHVIAPSLQGYGGSPPATAMGMSPSRIARRHTELMKALGYSRYTVQGGDWGSLISGLTGIQAPDQVIAVHLNLSVAVPPDDVADPMSLVRPLEMKAFELAKDYAEEGAGYYHVQRTRPQTLGYALTDSPAGWCAWVTEKFDAWCDCERDGNRDIRNAISWDALLTNISLYWFTGTINSSMRLYRENTLELGGGALPTLKGLRVPVGLANYPGEFFRTPRAWAERQFRLIHWFEAERGGHFAAMEQPQTFAEDLWRFKHAALDNTGSR